MGNKKSFMLKKTSSNRYNRLSCRRRENTGEYLVTMNQAALEPSCTGLT